MRVQIKHVEAIQVLVSVLEAHVHLHVTVMGLW